MTDRKLNIRRSGDRAVVAFIESTAQLSSVYHALYIPLKNWDDFRSQVIDFDIFPLMEERREELREELDQL
jgi:hypothetical protein